MKIGVVILNYNSEEDTIRLYGELNSQIRTNFDLEIIVVDNSMSQESTDQLKKKISEKRLLINKQNNGYAGGNNLGIQSLGLMEYDYFLIVNPDIHIPENLLISLVDSMESTNEIAAIGPRICEWGNKELIYSDGGKLYRNNPGLVKHINNGQNTYSVETKLDTSVDYVNGSCILIRSEALQDIGLLNEIYFMYFEETDWCTRAKKKGWLIAIDRYIKVYHTPSNKSKLYHFYMTRNRILFAKSNNISLAKILYRHFKLIVYHSLKSRNGLSIALPMLRGTFTGLIKPYSTRTSEPH